MGFSLLLILSGCDLTDSGDSTVAEDESAILNVIESIDAQHA